MLVNKREQMGTSTYHLLRYHHDGLDGELPVAVVEQVLQAGSQQIYDQYVVEALLAKVVYIGDSSYQSVS